MTATPTGPRRADVLAAAGAWHRISCGNGAKGRRWYDWALFATSRPEISLLARRSVARPSELAFYLCHTPQPVPLAVLVKAAGTRWCAEECFQAGKNEAGLDHYQVRLYKAWYRYFTLAMLALAWLAVTRAALAEKNDQLMTSANEIRRMFAPCADRPATSGTPAAGHDGATATRNEHATATTRDDRHKVTKWGQECPLAAASGPWQDIGMDATRKGHAS